MTNTVNTTQIQDAMKLLKGGECDVTVIAESVGCAWTDFLCCGEQTLMDLADDYDWWFNYGQYEDHEA